MKRANGTGSVVRLSGERRRPYIVRIAARDKITGRVIQKPLSYHATAAEAQAALDTYNANRKTGASPAPDKLSLTVGQVYTIWSEREYKKAKPASIQSHKAAWNKRVSKYADKKMREITLDDWQAILDEDEANGASQSLINNDVILMRALSSCAMERDIIGKDYSQFLDIPSVDAKKKKGAFNDLQMRKLEELAASGFPWADTALMLCYTGFRITEFLELTRFAYHPEHGGYLQGGIKTEAGKDRIVPVHPKIAPYLKRYLEQGNDTIITRAGEKVSPSWYRSTAFHAIMKELGIQDATPHWCRHTFATMLHQAAVDPLTIKWLMGHSTKGDVTEKYTHSTIEVLEKAVKKLN